MSSTAFVGRRRELDLLAGELAQARRQGGRLVAVRGRRQVGKSRLVQQFVERCGAPYGVVAGMKGTPVGVQMRRAVATLAASSSPLPGLGAVGAVIPVDWYDLLARLALAVGDGPAVLVVDEFPWADETDPGLDGLLQSLWDGDLARRPVMVILVGSDEAMMDRLFEHDRPLFGRLDATLVVEPFDPVDTAAALGRGDDPLGVFDVQLVTGGFPELVLHAATFASTAEMVEAALSRPHSLLADVAQINLSGEVAESGVARVVLEAIGADEIGVLRFSRITDALGGTNAARTAVTRSLETLATKRIVAVDAPAADRGGRRRRYRVADSYLRFWFRFIEPQLRNVEVGRSDLAIAAYRASWATWRGRAIEPLVREGVLRLAPRLPAPFDRVESVDGWWDRAGSVEVDIVGTDRTGDAVTVGSIKWRANRRFSAGDRRNLADVRALLPLTGEARLLAVAPLGADPTAGLDLAIDASQLLEAWTM